MLPSGADLPYRDIAIEIALIGLLTSLCPALVGAQRPDARAGADTCPYYTVQLQAAPADRRDRVFQAYDNLKAKGYLVYCRSAYVHEQAYIRLRTGYFNDRDQAQVHAEALRVSEGFDGFVVRANLRVASFGDAFDIITTPNDIWFRSEAALRLLYHFETIEMATTCSAVAICPAGQSIALACDNNILRIDLPSGDVTVLKQGPSEDALFESTLAWSPDGRYIAYLDKAGWEVPTSLWVMRCDGDNDRLLVGDATGRTRVKSLQWHPHKDELFYVSGPTHGTISVGGSLVRVDLYGRRETVVPACPTERTELCSTFRIVGDEVHYRLAHFDADYLEIEYTPQKILLNPRQ